MRKQKIPRLLTILIMTVITIVFWVAVEVYRALTIKPAPTVPAGVLLELSANLDGDVLGGLEKRVYIADEEITPIPLRLSAEVQLTETAAPTQSPTPTASAVPETSPEPETTPSP